MKNILAAIDFSDVTDDVIKHSSELAEALEAKLHIIHADPVSFGLDLDVAAQNMVGTPMSLGINYGVPPVGLTNQEEKELHEQITERSSQKLEEIKKQLSDKGLDVDSILLEGEPKESIKEEAANLDADLIVIGSHKHGALHRFLFGDLGSNFISEVARPVLVVPQKS